MGLFGKGRTERERDDALDALESCEVRVEGLQARVEAADARAERAVAKAKELEHKYEQPVQSRVVVPSGMETNRRKH